MSTKKKSELQEALSVKPQRPLDPAAMSNDTAALKNLVAQLNATPRGVDPNAPVDTTKYDAPTGAANATILTDSSVDEAREQALNAALNAQRQGASEKEILEAAKQATPVVGSVVLLPPAPLGQASLPPHPAAHPQTPIVSPQRARRLVLTGRRLPELVTHLPAFPFALDAEAKRLAYKLFPGISEDAHGLREFISTIYAWGTGEISPLYPLTAERALFVALAAGLQPGFGKPGFWIDAIVNAAKQHSEARPDDLIIITGIPDLVTLRYFVSMGFQHWHITGPAGAVVDPFSSQLDQDTIRVVSQQRQGPKLRAVWNDQSPCNPRLWTTKEFLQAFQ